MECSNSDKPLCLGASEIHALTVLSPDEIILALIGEFTDLANDSNHGVDIFEPIKGGVHAVRIEKVDLVEALPKEKDKGVPSTTNKHGHRMLEQTFGTLDRLAQANEYSSFVSVWLVPLFEASAHLRLKSLGECGGRGGPLWRN